jgi:hypothetical protein
LLYFTVCLTTWTRIYRTLFVGSFTKSTSILKFKQMMIENTSLLTLRVRSEFISICHGYWCSSEVQFYVFYIQSNLNHINAYQNLKHIK